MKVLLVSDYGTPTGGAELMTLMFRDRLRERGHDARLFTSSARPVDVPIAADATCVGTQGPGRRVLQAVNPWAWMEMRRILRTFEPDVVHVRMFLSQLSPLVIPPLTSVPAVLHCVNYQLICPLNTKRLPSGVACVERAGAVCRASGCVSTLGLARFALQRTLWERWRDAFDVVLANSAWTASRLRADGVHVDHHVSYGVPELPEPEPLASVPTIAFVGRLFAKKGVGTLLDAMAIVVREMPHARLVVIGTGPELARLREQASSLELEQNVAFLGFRARADIDRELRGAWVQVVPSHWEEPMGVVVLEAMMRGTAVVATNTGGPSEVVAHGHTGLLVPPAEPRALAEALSSLLSDPETARRFGEAGRQIARARYTEEHSVSRIEEAYEEAIRRHALRRR